MRTSPSDPSTEKGLDYASLLAKHGYSAAGYEAAVQEAVDGMLGARQAIAQPVPLRETLTEEVQNQLFHVVLTRIASPTLVLEQLRAFFHQERPLLAPEVTLYLLQRLGPLQKPSFYHPRPAYLPAQTL